MWLRWKDQVLIFYQILQIIFLQNIIVLIVEVEVAALRIVEVQLVQVNVFYFSSLDSINHEKFGQSIVSKFKNSVNSSFTKERRPGPDDKSKKNFPGFKYKRFS